MEISSFLQFLDGGSNLAKGSGLFEGDTATGEWKPNGGLTAQTEPISFLQTITKLLDETGPLKDFFDAETNSMQRVTTDSEEINGLGHMPLFTVNAENQTETHRKDRGQTICSLELDTKRRGIMNIGPFFQNVDGRLKLTTAAGLSEGATAISGWQSDGDLNAGTESISFIQTIKTLIAESGELEDMPDEEAIASRYLAEDLTQLMPLVNFIQEHGPTELQELISPDAKASAEALEGQPGDFSTEQIETLKNVLGMLSDTGAEEQAGRQQGLVNKNPAQMETALAEAATTDEDQAFKGIESKLSPIRKDVDEDVEEQALTKIPQEKTQDQTAPRETAPQEIEGQAESETDFNSTGRTKAEGLAVEDSLLDEVNPQGKEASAGRIAASATDAPVNKAVSTPTDDSVETQNDFKAAGFWKQVGGKPSATQNETAPLAQSGESSEVLAKQIEPGLKEKDTDSKADRSRVTTAQTETKATLSDFRETPAKNDDLAKTIKAVESESKQVSATVKSVFVDSSQGSSQGQPDASARENEKDFHEHVRRAISGKHQDQTTETDMTKGAPQDMAKPSLLGETSMELFTSEDESVTENKQSANSTTRPAATQDADDIKFQKKVMDQIVEKATLRTVNDRSEVRIQLKPESLGDVRMSVVSEKNQLAVHMVADKVETKEIIENQLHHLKAELDKQGITVSRIEVTISADSGQQDNRGQFSQMFRNNPDNNGKRQNNPQQETFNQHPSDDGSATDDTEEGINYFV